MRESGLCLLFAWLCLSLATSLKAPSWTHNSDVDSYPDEQNRVMCELQVLWKPQGWICNNGQPQDMAKWPGIRLSPDSEGAEKHDIKWHNTSICWKIDILGYSVRPFMTSLTLRTLSSLQLSGTIPDMSKLLLLTSLNLSVNKFTGNVSPTLYNLAYLQRLDLSNNSFSGDLKWQMTQTLLNLKYCDLSNNDLSGPLPTLPLGSIHFDAHGNQFSGAIPKEYKELNLLQFIDASFNNLTGHIVPFAPSIKHIALANNKLSGSVGANWKELTFLDISSNVLTGEIPFVTQLHNIQDLNIEDNKFNGPLVDFSPLQYLDTLRIGKNSFTPGCFQVPPKLRDCDATGVTVWPTCDQSNLRNCQNIKFSNCNEGSGFFGPNCTACRCPANFICVDGTNGDALMNVAMCGLSSFLEIPEWTCNNGTPSTPFCSWPGVTCYNGVVTELDLQNLSIDELPDEIGYLDRLEILRLNDNPVLDRLAFTLHRLPNSIRVLDLTGATYEYSITSWFFFFSQRIMDCYPKNLQNLTTCHFDIKFGCCSDVNQPLCAGTCIDDVGRGKTFGLTALICAALMDLFLGGTMSLYFIWNIYSWNKEKHQLEDFEKLPTALANHWKDAINNSRNWKEKNDILTKKITDHTEKHFPLVTLWENLDATDVHVEDIYAVYNPNMVKAFINARKTLVNTTRPRKKHEETESREWVEKEFRKKCGKYEWNCGGMDDNILVGVIGANPDTAWQLCESGFTTLKGNGAFGAGVEFHTSMTPVIAKKACVIICYIIPGHTFPVTSALRGSAIQPGYHSHFVVTDENGNPAVPATKKKYDRIILDQFAQVCPAYVVYTGQDKSEAIDLDSDFTSDNDSVALLSAV